MMNNTSKSKGDNPTRRDLVFDRLRNGLVGDPDQSSLLGGRSEALRRLQSFDPTPYGRTRNFIDSPVSRFSPYLRHGMISLVEVREHLKARFPNDAAHLDEFLRQLAWRDFFEKVLAWYGRAIEEDLEEPKHSVHRSERIPLDVLKGDTGLPCIDGMLEELYKQGYLHNHARLWFAAYLCHFRGVRWQEGARLFRQYLYDGDIASNSASWQWVEGTFAAKPYFMNKENIAKFSGSLWCENCRVKCPFDADYPSLQNRLFSGSKAPLESSCLQKNLTREPLANVVEAEEPGFLPASPNLVWVHDAAISWDDQALTSNPDAAVSFVFDEPTLKSEPWSSKRFSFVMDGLDDLFAHLPNPTKLIRVGDPVEQLTILARNIGASTIHLSEHPNTSVVETVQKLKSNFHVVVHPRPVFATYSQEPKRFSRYWEKVAPEVLGHPVKSSKRMHK
jgi:deoxyribodipyrimidine photo-lyase